MSHAGARSATASASLRIMTYNVRYFAHATRGVASTARSMRAIARAIATLDPIPDFVCLQEVETRSLRSTFAHRTPKRETQLEQMMRALSDALQTESKPPESYEAYYFPAHTYRLALGANFYTTGLAILAHRRFHINDHNAREPRDITHRRARTRAVRRLKQTRICGHVRFDGPAGGSIDIFNTHLSLPSLFSRAFWRGGERMGHGPNQIREAEALAEFVEQHRKSDRFIVVGDFNTRPGSPVYEYLTRQVGLSDVHALANDWTPADSQRWPTAGFMRLRFHLDYIFAGRGLSWTDFDDSHPFGQRGGRFHGLSDHVPIIGRFRVRARGPA